MAVSAQILTDVTTVRNTVGAVTLANANAPAGVIMDVSGNIELIQVKIYEIKRMITELLKDFDPATDAANITLLSNIQSTLV